jgi:citrate lyase subunit beta / citryl-CoA lyase
MPSDLVSFPTRSLMFVPGSKQRMIEKSVAMINLDLAIYDIEDGVAPQEKALARNLIGELLAQPRSDRAPLRYVRCNRVGSGADRIDADLELVGPGLDGVVVPKVDNPDQLKHMDWEIARREQACGVAPGTIRLIAAVESPIGLLNAPHIATASTRLVGLLFGAEDYSLELGLPSNREAEARDLVFARSWFANAAASGHVDAFDGVWPDITDLGGARHDALLARRLGMTGKSLFHPSQIDVINEIFTPSPAEIDYAAQVVAAFDEARARGDGAVAFGGQLLDLPIVERARRSLALTEFLSRRMTR